jgi:hypothetical protein
MAIVISKKVKVDSQFEMVKLQFLLYCFLKNINLSNSDLDCLTTIAIKGYSKHVIEEIVEKGVFKSQQTVRNCIVKLTNLGILVKDTDGRKINPNLSIGVDATIIMDLKIANLP